MKSDEGNGSNVSRLSDFPRISVQLRYVMAVKWPECSGDHDVAPRLISRTFVSMVDGKWEKREKERRRKRTRKVLVPMETAALPLWTDGRRHRCGDLEWMASGEDGEHWVDPALPGRLLGLYRVFFLAFSMNPSIGFWGLLLTMSHRKKKNRIHSFISCYLCLMLTY